MNQTKSILLG